MKIYYSGYGDWMIDKEYAYASYGGYDYLYTHEKDWPSRLQEHGARQQADATQIYHLIKTIFASKNIKIIER